MKRLSIAALTLLLSFQAQAADSFKICWSIYVGWMPWGYGAEQQIVDKWADKYDIDIEVVQINDYIESINQYTAGEFDACTMTNMDALTIPAAGGVDTTALIVGDFSDGNDGIVLKDKSELADIEGQDVNLVELSVSHYLLARALETVGMSERDVDVVNTSDADLVAAYQTDDVTSVVTWNPLLSAITEQPGANLVFDSSQIPGEIIDLMVVNTDTLEANPKLGKALAGGRRDQAVIATKVGMNWSADGKVFRDSSAARIRREVEDSLRRLRTDRIDLYQVHWPDPKVPIEEVAQELEALRLAGKIRAIGVSNHSPEQMRAFGAVAQLATTADSAAR